MVVESQCKGRKVTGLRVGVQNARQFIQEPTAYIELRLGHLQILCPLAADFWQGDGEIHDPRLCAWLEAKQFNQMTNGLALPWAMIPDGANSFRLEPAVGKPVKSVPLASRKMASSQAA
jgi:hypothetical protein